MFGSPRELPQVVWPGSNPNGNEFGKGLSAWLATGGDIQQAFDANARPAMMSAARNSP